MPVPEKTPKFEILIKQELRFFESDEMRNAFYEASTAPFEIIERWIYGDELHRCWVVAKDSQRQIVYCQTGFGPEFPWSAQPFGAEYLGTDGEWCAYLFEAFVTSGIWSGKAPEDFILMGPGERTPPLDA